MLVNPALGKSMKRMKKVMIGYLRKPPFFFNLCVTLFFFPPNKLRYNWHTINIRFLKCIVWYTLTYVYAVKTSHLLLLLFSRAAPEAYGSFQARDRIGTVVAGLHHSHSNTRSELRLSPTPQLILNPLSKARDQTWVLMDASQMRFRWGTQRELRYHC